MPNSKQITYRKSSWWKLNQQRLTPWIFLFPGLLLFLVYVIWPIFNSLYISLLQWDGLSPAIYVGLSNYIELLDDEYFYISLLNNLKWLILFMLAVPIGLGLAIFLNQTIFGIKLIKSLFFFHILLFFLTFRGSEEEGTKSFSGSLERREKGELRAVVCTGTLDLGIDWNEVDLVIQVGAPKNIKRLVQRIGRANHTYNTPSKAIIVPANKFEIVECQAALEAVRDKDLDGEPIASGSLDVLCQHILLVACSGKILPAKLFEEIKQIGAYKNLTHEEFKECMGFCIDGGYALKRYEQWHRLKLDHSGNLILRDPRIANKIRMNVGTIQDTETLKVRTHRRSGGKPLGEIEEAFAASLTKGDTFLIGGNIVRFESLREMIVEVTHNANKQPKIATFMGTKFATSTKLSDRILDSFENQSWKDLPADTVNWLNKQKEFSQLPVRNSLLIETFFRKSRHYLVVYGFAGRNANQTLGLILSKKLEELNLAPLGFVANDYATLIWGLEKVENPIQLFKFSEIELGLDKWFSGNALMKRTFKAVASVSGLIDRNLPGLRKSGRQTTFSSDILYDTLVKYDPTHLLLKITKDEAMKGLIDFSRIEEMFKRVDDNIIHKNLPHVSPLAAPMLLEVGTIPIEGQARELLLKNEANSLMKEAGL